VSTWTVSSTRWRAEAAPPMTADDPDGGAALRRYAASLAEGVEKALPGWVERSVAAIMAAWSGQCPPEVVTAAHLAAVRARDEVLPQLRELLAADVDDQRTTPLTLVRRAVLYPTGVLREAGVPPVVRDRFAERTFPEDVYGLSPASFADLDPAAPGLAETALAWGAAKAFVHKKRHSG
jgi:hypothetical protein